MKKFFSFLAAAAMLFTASCSNDDLGAEGDEAVISFSMNLNGVSSTKAIADGLKVDKLFYSVFEAKKDANGGTTYTHLHTYPAVEGIQFPYNLDIRLAKGKAYRVVFWAQDADCQAYTYTDGNVTVNYVGDNNDETRDAFCGYRDVATVTGSVKLDATLKRPFAQLNVGVTADDWTAAINSGVEITKSEVTVKKVANSISLIDGTIGGNTTDVTYAYAVRPDQMLGVDLNGDKDTEDEGEQFHYLSMSYLLVEKNDVSADFKFSTEDGHEIALNVPVVPVQRNHRTNILGQILTGTVTFEIKIDANFDGDLFAGPIKVVKTADELQAAIDAAQKGDIIYVAAGQYDKVIDVTGGKDITIQAQTTRSGASSVVIAGLDHQSNGTPSTVRVKGIVFDNSIAEGWFTGTAQNIAPCVGAWGGYFTFENCEFIVAGTSKRETGVMTWWTTELVTMTFKNCTFNGKDDHDSARAMQIYGNVNMTVEGCTFNTKKDYTLKYVAQEGNVATFKNNVVNNSENFVELGSSVYPGKNYTANIINNTYGKGVNTHVIANPEGQIVNVDGVIKQASTNDEIANAIKEGATEITLAKGEYVIPSAAKGKTLTIKGTGNPEDVKVAVTKVGTGYENCDYGLDGSTVTFEGITITTNSSTYIGYARCNGTYKNCVFNGTYTLYGNSIFENCTFNVSGDVYNIWTWGAPTAKFTKCTFNSDGKALLLYGTVNTELTVDNCTFNDKGGLTDKKAAIEIGNDYGTSYKLVVNSTVVNGYEINDKGINTGTTLWANKNSMGSDKLNVVVDGVDIY